MIETIFNDSLYAIEIDRTISSSDCQEIRSSIPNEIKSNEGGYHSTNCISYPLLQPLIQNIQSHANLYSQSLGLKESTVANIWCNINGYMDYNKSHAHPQSCLSGVYYVATPKDCGSICFVRQSSTWTGS